MFSQIVLITSESNFKVSLKSVLFFYHEKHLDNISLATAPVCMCVEVFWRTRQPQWLGGLKWLYCRWRTHSTASFSCQEKIEWGENNVDEAIVLNKHLMTGLHNTSAMHSGLFLAPVGVEIGLSIYSSWMDFPQKQRQCIFHSTSHYQCCFTCFAKNPQYRLGRLIK